MVASGISRPYPGLPSLFHGARRVRLHHGETPMIPIKVGMVLGTVMVIAALSSAAPGFNYPACQNDNGSTCPANGCWIDEATRIVVAPGGQVQVVFFTDSRSLYKCVPNVQRTYYECAMNQTTCPGDRYTSVY